MRFPTVALLALVIALTGCGRSDSPTDAVSFDNGADVIQAMQQMYAGDWYETLTFVQTTINHGPGGTTDTTLWYEALKLPGRLRIDIAEPGSGDSWIFRSDSIYVFAQGQLANAVPRMHPLLLLGFDVYHLPTDVIVSKLDTLGFDLTKVYETEWEGRDVYAVGADSAGTDAPEFWIDRERMVFVRLLQNVGPGGSVRQDIRFESYEPLGDAWISPRVLFFADSTLMLEEIYNDIEIGAELEDGLFEPGTWQSVEHWAAAEDASPIP